MFTTLASTTHFLFNLTNNPLGNLVPKYGLLSKSIIMRLMGIDYGEKRIGLAISDEAGDFAFAHSVVDNCPTCWGAVLEKIKDLVQEKNVAQIVLGESVNYKGEPNPIMIKIKLFKKKLEHKLSLPVVYQSETMTTSESLRDPGRTGPRGNVSDKRKIFKINKNDASAAALILRSYIERQSARNTDA